MKLQLDTENKTIKIEQNIKFKDLIDTLEKLLPKGIWKEFTLETNTQIINWTNPIYIEKHIPCNPYPWWTYSSSTTENKMLCQNRLRTGTYNVEC